ncbi:MAG: FAD-dependent oxidoreductase [Pseudomonadota bacterium]
MATLNKKKSSGHLLVDIIIMGGGIAGLWLLNRLRHSGYNAVLFECGDLGCGQTIKSQGIIHGGLKYALNGSLTSAASAIADMPGRWRACLDGNGEIDLMEARMLSPYHYLWSTSKLSSHFATFFASKVLRNRVEAVPKQDYPMIFKNPAFKGSLYRLDEIVLDVPSVIKALAKPQISRISRVDWGKDARMEIDNRGYILSVELKAPGRPVMSLNAQRYVFTGGIGNEQLLREMAQQQPAMQRRPLHMVIVKHRNKASLFGHCLGTGPRPRVTITSHPSSDGYTVWYLGGDIAETGVKRDTENQIKAAQKELQTLLPWVGLPEARWSTLTIERAEPVQRFGQRPDTSFAREVKNAIVAWPTKMALSPRLSDEIILLLHRANIQPLYPAVDMPEYFHPPEIAKPIWEELQG